MRNESNSQKTILGMPYEFRRPTMARARARLWNPGGPLFPPKVWGVGWALNFAHPGAWVVVAAVTTLVMLTS